MSTSQVLVTFPVSSPLEIALWHPVAIKSFYSLSVLNLHSICCERNLLRMQAAVRAMSELRDLNSPDLPKLVHPPTFSVWFKCRARLCLTLVIVTESDPGTDWLSCLNSDLPHHHGHACSSLPRACPYCPVAASQVLSGLGPGGWGQLYLVASCSLGSNWSPSSFHITFHTSSAFVFAKPSFCVHISSHLLPFLLSKSLLSHPPTSTWLLTCWWTVSFLLSLLGCHGLAF